MFWCNHREEMVTVDSESKSAHSFSPHSLRSWDKEETVSGEKKLPAPPTPRSIANKRAFHPWNAACKSNRCCICCSPSCLFIDRNMEFIWWLANRLTSYDEEMHKEILEDFFTDDAK